MPPNLISVIVPCYDETAIIRGLLEGLTNQSCGHENLEAVISYSGSTDGTIEAIHEFPRQHPQLHRRLIDNPDQTNPAGLNRAISAAFDFTSGYQRQAPRWMQRKDSLDYSVSPIDCGGATLKTLCSSCLSWGNSAGSSAMKTSDDWEPAEGFAYLVETRWPLFDQFPPEVPIPIVQSSLRTFRGTHRWLEVNVRNHRRRNDPAFS